MAPPFPSFILISCCTFLILCFWYFSLFAVFSVIFGYFFVYFFGLSSTCSIFHCLPLTCLRLFAIFVLIFGIRRPVRLRQLISTPLDLTRDCLCRFAWTFSISLYVLVFFLFPSSVHFQVFYTSPFAAIPSLSPP